MVRVHTLVSEMV